MVDIWVEKETGLQYVEFLIKYILSSMENNKGDYNMPTISMFFGIAEIHKDELLADWDLASKGELPFKIDPLK